MTNSIQLPKEIKFQILSSLSEEDLNTAASLDKSWRDAALQFYADKKFNEIIHKIEFIKSIFSEFPTFKESRLKNFLSREVYKEASSFDAIKHITKISEDHLIVLSKSFIAVANKKIELITRLFFHVDSLLSMKQIEKAELITSIISNKNKREDVFLRIVKLALKYDKLELAWKYFDQLQKARCGINNLTEYKLTKKIFSLANIKNNEDIISKLYRSRPYLEDRWMTDRYARG